MSDNYKIEIKNIYKVFGKDPQGVMGRIRVVVQ